LMNTTTSGSSIRRFYAAVLLPHRNCTSDRLTETSFTRTSGGWSQAFAARKICP